MPVKDTVKSMMRAKIAHIYEVKRGGITSYHDPRLVNKLYLVLGDDKSLREFQEQFHNPYGGVIAV